MSIWGHTADGTAVPIYTLTGGQIEVRVTAYGAHLVSVKTPDRTGKMADVVLGFGGLEGYTTIPNGYLGAVVGRYGNRIALGKFTLDGKTYQIPINNGANALHGGPKGFDQYEMCIRDSIRNIPIDVNGVADEPQFSVGP